MRINLIKLSTRLIQLGIEEFLNHRFLGVFFCKVVRIAVTESDSDILKNIRQSLLFDKKSLYGCRMMNGNTSDASMGRFKETNMTYLSDLGILDLLRNEGKLISIRLIIYN